MEPTWAQLTTCRLDFLPTPAIRGRLMGSTPKKSRPHSFGPSRKMIMAAQRLNSMERRAENLEIPASTPASPRINNGCSRTNSTPRFAQSRNGSSRAAGYARTANCSLCRHPEHTNPTSLFTYSFPRSTNFREPLYLRGRPKGAGWEFPANRVAAGEAAVAHELVHVFFPNANRMLAEGLAVHLHQCVAPNPAFPNFKNGLTSACSAIARNRSRPLYRRRRFEKDQH